MHIFFSKKYLLVGTILFLSLVLFVLPIRCSQYALTPYENGDVVTSTASGTCYSIYHKNYWTALRTQPVQYILGFRSLVGWFYGDAGRRMITAPDGTQVEEVIIHHA